VELQNKFTPSRSHSNSLSAQEKRWIVCYAYLICGRKICLVDSGVSSSYRVSPIT